MTPSWFDIVALLLTLTAVFSYLNHRWVRLPTTIGVMLIALVLSVGLVALGQVVRGPAEYATALLERIDFDTTLMQGMLSFLLFAGALHINFDDLVRRGYTILILATFGVVLSTLLVGLGLYGMLPMLGMTLPLAYALVFGALISPTDPIAVLGILKTVRVPRSLEAKIAGESLFNDGVGVVVFLILAEVAVSHQPFSFGHTAVLFLEEAVGGALLGFALGWLTYRMLRSVDNYQVEVLLTLALVCGGYALAGAIHVSGPIATVVAGLLIGNRGRRFAMSEQTRQHLDTFWELVDEILNAVLFVLIGFELLALDYSWRWLAAGVGAIPLVLGARFVSVGLPVTLLRRWRRFTPGAVRVMTWGGLRGGISVALALSLPPSRERDLLLAVTYLVVVFSILVQGLTIARVVRRVVPQLAMGHDGAAVAGSGKEPA